jgi:hypothetical protein
MDRPDRPNGLPSQARGLPENPAQGRRAAAAAAAAAGTNAIPPLPKLPSMPSNSSLLVPPALSSSQVINVVRDAMKAALDENDTQASDATGMTNELRPGVTINLSHKNIAKLPDDIVDIIKDQLERYVKTDRCEVVKLTEYPPCSLALSHNALTAFPTRFSECTSLRYLNVRNNRIKDFPMPVSVRKDSVLDSYLMRS